MTDEELQAFIDGELGNGRRKVVLELLAEDQALANRVDALLRQTRGLRQIAMGLDLGDSSRFCPDLQRAIVARWNRPRWSRKMIAAAASVALLASFGTGAVLLGSLVQKGPVTATNDAGNVVDTASTPVVSKRDAPVAAKAENPTAPATSQAVTTAPSTPSAPADGMQAMAEAPAQLAGPAMSLFSGFGTGIVSGDLAKAIEEGDAPIGWLTSKLVDYSLRKPDLDVLGLRFLGGKVLSSAQMPSIRLVYADGANKHVFLYAGVLPKGTEPAFTLVAEGYLSLHWRQGPLLFALVAPTDSPQLDEIVRLASEGVANVTPPSTSDTVAVANPDPLPAGPVVRDLGVAERGMRTTHVVIPMPRPTTIGNLPPVTTTRPSSQGTMLPLVPQADPKKPESL